MIPVHMEYLYPKGRFRPRLAYGINIWLTPEDLPRGNLGFSNSISLEARTNIQLVERVFLTASVETEFSPFLLFIPFHLFPTSGRLGVLVEL